MRMSSVRRLFALAVMASILAVLPGCHSNPTGQQQGPQYIMLTYNNGNCQQNGSSGVIDIWSSQSVIYQGASALNQFNIQFSGTSCPFAASNCPVNSPNGNAINVGQPTGSAVNNTFYYSSITINNQTCNGVGSMGVRVKPGP
jgi:hypothetical protein